MNVLELFAGSRSFSKVADSLGYKTFTSDIKPFDKIDSVTDILEFDCAKVPFKPDCIWASPPCTFFSVASIGKHWNKDHTPKTKEAILGCKIVIKTLEIIDYFQPDYFFIENPRGLIKWILELVLEQSLIMLPVFGGIWGLNNTMLNIILFLY